MNDDTMMKIIDRRCQAGGMVLFACGMWLSACSTPAQRYAESFVRWDAVSDATSSAEERCGGSAYLIAGRRGYSPDDYSCESNQKRKVVESGGTHMMLVPQRNGSVSAVPINTGAVVDRSKDKRPSSDPDGLALSAKVVKYAFDNQRIAAHNEANALDADYEPSPVTRYSAARCHRNSTNPEYTCRFRLRYRYSRKWHEVEHQFRSLGDGRWIVAS